MSWMTEELVVFKSREQKTNEKELTIGRFSRILL